MKIQIAAEGLAMKLALTEEGVAVSLAQAIDRAERGGT